MVFSHITPTVRSSIPHLIQSSLSRFPSIASFLSGMSNSGPGIRALGPLMMDLRVGLSSAREKPPPLTLYHRGKARKENAMPYHFTKHAAHRCLRLYWSSRCHRRCRVSQTTAEPEPWASAIVLDRNTTRVLRTAPEEGRGKAWADRKPA